MRVANLNPEEELKAIEKRLVEIIVDLGFLKGRSRKTSEILAHLYIYNKVTQRMLREITGYSTGTVSSTLRELQRLGLICRSGDLHGREYVYELAVPVSQQLSRYSGMMDQYFRVWNEFLERLENELRKKQLSKKKGADNIFRFIEKMRVVIQASARAVHGLQSTASETQQEKGVRRRVQRS